MSNNYETAPVTFLSAILLNVISWITLVDAQYFVSFIATILGAISAIFVIRYYYYAGNEKKNNVNRKSNQQIK